jgi:DNA-nicking Smr family endonuclease
MKKQKPQEKPAADFKTSPFKSLKGFAPKPAPQEKKQAAPPFRPAKEHQEEDDASLFLRAVDGAKRIDPVPAVPEELHASAVVSPCAVPQAPGDQQLFLQAMQKLGATVRDHEPEEEFSARSSASSRMRQLKKGTIRISEELDLHGYLKDEAQQRLARFISGAYHRGSKAVLVITGKGLNSPDGPVLQGSVDAWLREQGRSMVVEAAQAPRDKGGSGAVVVFLRTKKTEQPGPDDHHEGSRS